MFKKLSYFSIQKRKRGVFLMMAGVTAETSSFSFLCAEIIIIPHFLAHNSAHLWIVRMVGTETAGAATRLRLNYL